MIETIFTIICSVLSLVAAIIIAIVQYKQAKRMEALAFRQDKEEKRRREESVKVQRNTFIMKYSNKNDEIYMLPLCWIASIYNPTFSYRRKMYMEFNMLEQDVQDAICEYMQFCVERPNIRGDAFYSACVDAVMQKESEYAGNKNIGTIFYDNAKFLYSCLNFKNEKTLPIDLYNLENEITDYFCDFQQNSDTSSNPIEEIDAIFRAQDLNNYAACEICAVAAKWIAKWQQRDCDKNNYWIPGEYGYETLSTTEDLFLCALFCIYVYLLLPKQQGVLNDET